MHTEFGVPRQNDIPQSSAISDATRTALPGHHRRYAWLGAKQRSTELDTGAITMGVRAYLPTLGRFLQTDPVQGGSANAYDYANQDPINTFDLNGEDTWWNDSGDGCNKIGGTTVNSDTKGGKKGGKKGNRGGPGKAPTGQRRPSRRRPPKPDKKRQKPGWKQNPNNDKI